MMRINEQKRAQLVKSLCDTGMDMNIAIEKLLDLSESGTSEVVGILVRNGMAMEEALSRVLGMRESVKPSSRYKLYTKFGCEGIKCYRCYCSCCSKAINMISQPYAGEDPKRLTIKSGTLKAIKTNPKFKVSKYESNWDQIEGMMDQLREFEIDNPEYSDMVARVARDEYITAEELRVIRDEIQGVMEYCEEEAAGYKTIVDQMSRDLKEPGVIRLKEEIQATGITENDLYRIKNAAHMHMARLDQKARNAETEDMEDFLGENVKNLKEAEERLSTLINLLRLNHII